jgi:hypothetical protein
MALKKKARRALAFDRGSGLSHFPEEGEFTFDFEFDFEFELELDFEFMRSTGVS